MGTKGPRVTAYISLPGRYLVLMPFSNHIGVSRRIEEEAERRRLKTIVAEARENAYGYIVRTAAEGIDAERILHEKAFLTNLWENIRRKFKTASTPSLIHRELSLSLRAVRDLLVHEADRLVIDSKAEYDTICTFLDTFMPNLKARVELYDGREPVFDQYNLEGDISRALKRKVWLKSGGYIIIEHTEALVANTTWKRRFLKPIWKRSRKLPIRFDCGMWGGSSLSTSSTCRRNPARKKSTVP
jgi:ribonuclease G